MPTQSYGTQFELLSARSQWLAWMVSIASITIVLILAYALFGNASGILFVILGLFAATLYKSFRDISFLDKKTRLASDQVSLLVELNDVGAFLDEARKSVFRAHIAALHTIFLAHPQIDQDNLIEVLHARLKARNRVVELFASILITLGLIGTIVGLIQSIGGLGNVISASNDIDAMQQGLNETLGGLGTAFYTTLLGALFGGVMLRILTSVVDANITRYTAHLAELTEVNVLPAMRRMATRLERGGYYEKLDEHGSAGMGAARAGGSS
ncbi:MAG: MotA/TolQ/ExbB proton channel family protein [Planctomycetota bacterium]